MAGIPNYKIEFGLVSRGCSVVLPRGRGGGGSSRRVDVGAHGGGGGRWGCLKGTFGGESLFYLGTGMGVCAVCQFV